MEKFSGEMFDYYIIRDGKRVKLSMLKLDVNDKVDEDCGLNEDCINELNKSFVVNFD